MHKIYMRKIHHNESQTINTFCPKTKIIAKLQILIELVKAEGNNGYIFYVFLRFF